MDLLLMTYSGLFHSLIVADGIGNDFYFRFRTESLGGKQSMKKMSGHPVHLS